MSNNQDKNSENTNDTILENKDKGFEVSNQGQNLSGGNDNRKTIDVGEKSDNDDFSKTDQSITQAAPGQTVTNTNQGGSNA